MSINKIWTDVKADITAGNLSYYEQEFSGYYKVTTFDGPLQIFCYVDKGTADATDYEENFRGKSQPVNPKTSIKQIPKVSVYEPEGFFKSYVSHNLCDPTTWYQNSVQVTGETLTQLIPPSGLVYSFANQNIIDAENGKITGETDYSLNLTTFQNSQTLRDKYRVKIYINGVEQTSGYTVDYAAGTVTFTGLPGAAVTADYYYESGSKYVLEAPAGKVLQIRHVEIQFTKNITFQPIIQQIGVYNPLSPPNKMTVEYIAFLNEYDVINIGNQGKSYIPRYGVLPDDVLVFPFAYGRTIDLASSLGSEIALTLENDTPMGGDWATVTFYTTEVDE